MRYESAELAKISINMCLVASVSTANTLAELCEQIGADWSEIVPALKLDRRIGPYSYLAPGLGIAGGNLERDLATVCNFADQYGTDAGVVRAWVANSQHRKNWAASTLRKKLLNRQKDAIVAVWGLAYKENTHSTKNSPSLVAISQLQDVRLKVYDPVVTWNPVLHPSTEAVTEPLAALAGADALMIMTPWPEFKAIELFEIAKKMSGNIVLDPYGMLPQEETTGLDIITLGKINTML
jgi:UDPglucose 6-dehydrogenase